ncbi:UMP kinase [Candidatus Azambacteria bacterium RBG_16_47_10]|uniref:Uridylate kinase n=1 Tax=Candidatus Azambacteria bacterium RBG_16_47_10 TaxID=1797292 RepID=A0A1F5AZD0_9BACT|nr:MAG: UMP kinase [Candidatus Azambacteria bacterium RBG_16_47_10]
MKYKRILLKLSGEALLGSHPYGIDPKIASVIADQVKKVVKKGVQVAIVIGGGNIFRGYQATAENSKMDRATADYMGMLATAMNALALEDAFKRDGIDARVQSAIEMPKIAEGYIRKKAIAHLEKKRVVIFAAGTGNPYFSTDTAAALRALEIHADILMKATKVDGIYDKDPEKHKDAKKIARMTHHDVVVKRLKVMDMPAITLAMENELPILVFNIFKKDSIIHAVEGKNVGSLIG